MIAKINLIRIFIDLEMNNETEEILLETGKSENLTCIRPSEKYKIQWFKVEHNFSNKRFICIYVY